jgi:enoyl-CoA hydratase
MIDEQAKARVIVISSTGKHFTSGIDLNIFSQNELIGRLAGSGEAVGATDRDAFCTLVAYLQNTFNCLDDARMPVIATIQGGCIGAGVDMVSACDMRYCTEDAFFCIQEINLGMTADVGTFPRLCHLIPQGWVRELAYTGRRIDAQTAKAIGLVNEVYASHEEMMETVMACATEIAVKAPLAVAGSKKMINYARDHSVADTLDFIATWQAGMFEPRDILESVSAQSQKTTPSFSDLAPVKKEM